jgi:hypothetical protein
MIRFRHVISNRHQIFGKKERARYGKVEESLGYFLKRYPKASALCMEKPKPLKQLASPMSEIVRRKLPKGLDLDQAALLSFFFRCVRGLGGKANPQSQCHRSTNCR